MSRLDSARKRSNRGQWQGRDVQLAEGADTSHESAEDMWESLGNHWTTEREGDIAHPVCTVEQLDTLTDEAILAAIVEEEGGEISRDVRTAYESGIAYARGALDDMRGVESELEAAVLAYEEGGLEEVIEHLEAAALCEAEYGASPAADALAGELLEDYEEETLNLHHVTSTIAEVSDPDNANAPDLDWQRDPDTEGGFVVEWTFSIPGEDKPMSAIRTVVSHLESAGYRASWAKDDEARVWLYVAPSETQS